MRYYDQVGSFLRDGFTVIVDKTYEDISVADCFDDTCHDIAEINRKIDNGTYDWFMMRVRVFLEGVELGSSYLGGCLYENPEEVLTDGTAEDLAWEAIEEAKATCRKITSAYKELEPA